jgi:hypothetical protein
VPGIAVQKKVIYRVFIWIFLIFSIYILISIAPTLSNAKYLPSDDFVPYWASGRLNIYGNNPYDSQQIEKLQIAAGGEPSGTYTISIMLNPPWAISLVMPFGIVNYSISRFWWLICSVIFILISSIILWRIFSGYPKQRWLALLVVFIFAPTISVLEVGQIASLLLLGISGFLYFTVVNRNDWLAGAFLSLASIKPQVAYLFWVALLFWIIQERRWLLVISTTTSVMLLTLIAWLFNPHIIQQYLGMLQTYQISEWANPTIGAYLRFFWFGIDKFWLQFLPSIIGCIWLIYHWFKHHNSWNWVYELPLLLLVSQVTSSYTWTYDLVILIPAILQATVWIMSDCKRWSTLVFAGTFLTISILDLVLHMKLSDFWFIWVAPALLIWFLLIRWRYVNSQDNILISEFR